MKKKLAVVALGGNALQRSNEKGTINELISNTEKTMENVVQLLEKNYNLVISHGNGPQVGSVLLQNDAGESMYDIPSMPIDVAVAQTQGSIGYLLEKALRKKIKEKNLNKEVASLVTMVKIDKYDIAFSNPTKRVGKIYTKDEAEKLKKEKGWIFKEEKKEISGYRRVVPSPNPLDILNKSAILQLTKLGIIVIASGGGGIPVHVENNQIEGIEAVIDKDLASALLANLIGAEELIILTDVPYVYLNYGTDKQKPLKKLTIDEAKEFLKAGIFGEGNMAPKIKAAIQFIEEGGKKALITEANRLSGKDSGTVITK